MPEAPAGHRPWAYERDRSTGVGGDQPIDATHLGVTPGEGS
jgi:hypothetical protein